MGKSAAVRAAIRTSRGGESHELFEVSVSSYSVKELFGWEREGKWHFGIITNFLTGAQTGGQVASLQPCYLYTSRLFLDISKKTQGQKNSSPKNLIKFSKNSANHSKTQ